MKRVSFCLLIWGASWSLLSFSALAQLPPRTTASFQIISGTYTEVGGIWGTMTSHLPNAGLMFIQLSTNTQTGAVEMRFLDPQQKAGEFLLTNGLLTGNVIRFYQMVDHPYVLVTEKGIADYSVACGAGTISVNGTITFPPICCDIPTFYQHSNVVAVAMPQLDVRVSEIQISWNTESNRTYQVQYRSSLTQYQWTNLGAPILGSGQPASVPGRVEAGESGRFYRVLTLP